MFIHELLLIWEYMEKRIKLKDIYFTVIYIKKITLSLLRNWKQVMF